MYYNFCSDLRNKTKIESAFTTKVCMYMEKISEKIPEKYIGKLSCWKNWYV